MRLRGAGCRNSKSCPCCASSRPRAGPASACPHPGVSRCAFVTPRGFTEEQIELSSRLPLPRSLPVADPQNPAVRLADLDDRYAADGLGTPGAPRQCPFNGPDFSRQSGSERSLRLQNLDRIDRRRHSIRQCALQSRCPVRTHSEAHTNASPRPFLTVPTQSPRHLKTPTLPSNQHPGEREPHARTTEHQSKWL